MEEYPQILHPFLQLIQSMKTSRSGRLVWNSKVAQFDVIFGCLLQCKRLQLLDLDTEVCSGYWKPPSFLIALSTVPLASLARMEDLEFFCLWWEKMFFGVDRASPGFAKQFWANYKRWWCLESRSTCIVHVSYTMHIPVNPFGRTVRETVCKKEARIPHDHGSSGCCLAQEFMQLVKLVKLVSWWMTKSLMETRVRSFLFSLHTVDGRNPEHQLNRLQISTG